LLQHYIKLHANFAGPEQGIELTTF
jgi:hypothetical protein